MNLSPSHQIGWMDRASVGGARRLMPLVLLLLLLLFDGSKGSLHCCFAGGGDGIGVRRRL